MNKVEERVLAEIERREEAMVSLCWTGVATMGETEPGHCCGFRAAIQE